MVCGVFSCRLVAALIPLAMLTVSKKILDAARAYAPSIRSWLSSALAAAVGAEVRRIHHLDRHKSQLFYYLKLQGQPVNTADLWGCPPPNYFNLKFGMTKL